jgi:hypothetical protein
MENGNESPVNAGGKSRMFQASARFEYRVVDSDDHPIGI